jgi:hypothetical protein
MSTYENLYPIKSWFWTFLSFLIGFGVWFGIVYWIGTKDLGLCFVIALAMSSSVTVAKEQLMSFCKNLFPIFQSLDSHINGLIDEKNLLKEQIQELEDKVKVLEDRIDDLEDK